MLDDGRAESAFAGLSDPALVGRIHASLDELFAAREQTEQLLRVIVEIGSDLDLDGTLSRIITSAMTLTGARYGALGVRGEDGRLAAFLHSGVDSETARQIGHLPVGKGVLGFLLENPEPLRLTDLREHPSAAGFPEHHPPMRALLGVPIVIRGSVFGSLYLTDLPSARVFTESDEAVAKALAAAAAVAVDNAQLFQRMSASAEWTAASREITTALLSGVDPHLKPLQLIADRARELTDAEQAIVLMPDDPEAPAEQVSTLVVSIASGVKTESVIGQRIPVRGSTSGEVFRSGAPLITESFRHPIQSFTDAGERPAIVMPLRAAGTVIGVLAVARERSHAPFDAGHVGLMSDFADHAAVALTLAVSRERARELSLLADRERIAQDLHDHVIQKLFAAGMDLQGTVARTHSPQIAERLTRTIDDLQSTIDEIRSTIFGLQHSGASTVDLRHRIQRLVAGLTDGRNIITTLRMSGPMTVVDATLADHAEAVATEAISNTLRHSSAARLTVEISVGDELLIEITDNGQGIPADNERQSGLANLRRRARQVGGWCDISSPPEGGVRVRWSAPLIVLQLPNKHEAVCPADHVTYCPVLDSHPGGR